MKYLASSIVTAKDDKFFNFFKEMRKKQIDFFIESDMQNDMAAWYLDQTILNQYNEKYDIKYYDLSEDNLIDWEFQNDSKLWTGKGNRKYENKTYINKVADFEKLAHEKIGSGMHEEIREILLTKK